MSTDQNARGESTDDGAGKHASVRTLVALLSLEALFMVGLSAWFLFELVAAKPSSFVSALAIFVILLIATVFVAAIAIGAIRRRTWIRGGAVTWQIIQIAVAIGAFQGVFAQPGIGWLLLIPSLAVLVLLFTKPVIAVTRREFTER